LAAEDLRRLQAAAGEKGFEGLDQPSFLVRMEVSFDPLGTAPVFDGRSASFAMTLQIEQRTKGFGESDRRRKLYDLDIAGSSHTRN